MRVALITVGDTSRLTGGYLYQARVIAGLRERGLVVDEIVASGVRFADQLREADAFAAQFEPRNYDAIVIDALARVVCGQGVDYWRSVRPVAVLVHQLPSAAEDGPPTDDDQQAMLTTLVDGEEFRSVEAERRFDRACEDALLRTDMLIAVSKHGRNLLIDRGVQPERIAIISPGFDRLGTRFPVVSTRSRSGERVVLCVAQWIPRKGLLTLVSAWQQLSLSHTRLVLIGETAADPAYATKVCAAISRGAHGIEVRGVVSDAELEQAYRTADLFALPSRFEGYGMVFAEALSYGLPVLATNVGPIPELVTMEAGRFVAPDDEHALAEVLDRLLEDEEQRQALSEGARRRALTLPSWDDAVDGFIDVLAQVRRRTS